MTTSVPRSPTSFGPRNVYVNLFYLLLFFFPPSVNSVTNFQITSFTPDTANILCEGDASPSGGALELNLGTYTCRVGHARYAERILLWDSKSGKLTDFVTHFSFYIDLQDALNYNYGHGLAFFLAPVGFQIPPNSAGGFLGLFNTSNLNSSRNQIVEVEFDTNTYLQDWDPQYQHVGININSLSSSNYTAWNASLYSGDTADVTISYNATTKNLSVSWTYRTNPNFQENSSLSYQIDLKEILPEWVTIGFSAATGQYMERHVLQSWDFWSSLEMDTGGGNYRKKKLITGLTVSLGVLFAGGLVAFAFLWRGRRTERESIETVNLTSINDDLERGAGPRRFSYRDLVLATNNFSDARKLGEGGFGCVYRGFLTDLDMAVAVKKISRESKQGKKEYITEVKIISSLRHRNLVQLIGWCHDQTQFLLVYELMPNGSLDSHLFGKKVPLVWAVRYKIALGLASALLYLHEEWEQCVVHRDIKSSNIMLDSGFNVKLGDFGLARLMDHELGPQTTGLAGTFGYMAPEYVTTRKASKESDVYSFGVVALEIATGRKSTAFIEGKSETCLVEWLWELHGSGQLLSGVDGRLNLDFDAKQVECLVKVGLWCAHPDRNFRPSIRQAIQVLNFEISLPNLPTAMPVLMYYAPKTLAVDSEGAEVTVTSMNIGR